CPGRSGVRGDPAATAGLVRGAAADCAVRDLGEHPLKGLGEPERLFQLTAPDLADAFPPLRTLETIPNNLPRTITSFVGRDRELAELTRLVEQHQLVTLTGAGGAGKTRLALHVAAYLADRFRDGAWFVDLAPLDDERLVPS